MLSFDEIEDCFPDNTGTDNDGRMHCTAQWLHDFAHSVAAFEREACAKLCEDNCAGYSYGRETQGPCLTEFPKEGGGRHDGMTYAAAIRMRSNVI